VLVKDPSAVSASADGAPIGFKYISIETGLADSDYIEVLSGLVEGDEVAIEKRVFTNTIAFPRGQPGNPDTSYEEVDTP
jgi:HlyD family secretion protein